MERGGSARDVGDKNFQNRRTERKTVVDHKQTSLSPLVYDRILSFYCLVGQWAMHKFWVGHRENAYFPPFCFKKWEGGK